VTLAFFFILRTIKRLFNPPSKPGEDQVSGPDFLVHSTEDTVGVVVVETVKAGNDLTGLIMDKNETVTIKAVDDIPLGHKVAMGKIANGDTIIKYGHDIGKAVADILKGGHAHTQNVKTKKW
jgi:(2R)-sulfolactate sulfo-lyase subunit alpha